MDYAGSGGVLTWLRSISIAGLGLLVGAESGCRREVAPNVVVEDATLEVAFAGCGAVLGPPAARATTCELGEGRRLRLAPPAEAREVEVTLVPGGGTAGGAGAGGHENARPLDVAIPPGTTGVHVRARVAGRVVRFELALAEPSPSPALEAARSARARGDLAGARAALAGADGGARATSLLARIALSEGRADEAFPLFRAAIDAHRGAGRLGEAVDDSFALAFALHQRSRRYDEARAAMDAIADLLPRYPEGAARDPYYRGVLAAETGDRRTASTLLREAERRAASLGLDKLERNARAALALETLALGRPAEARALLRTLARDPRVSGCERAEIENDLGWTFLALEQEDGGREQARASLEAATTTPGCADAYVASFALANLARLDLEAGRVDDAARRLAEARARVKEPRGTDRLAWLDLEARLALAAGRRDEALRRFDEERTLARAALLAEAEWSAEVGRAEALAASGRAGEAARALEAAEACLERASLLVPLGGGRGGFLGAHERGARLAVQLEVGAGRLREAADTARRSRRRLVAALSRALAVERLPAEARAKHDRAVAAYRAAREALDREAAADWTLPASELVAKTAAREARERHAREALEAAIAELTAGEPPLPKAVHRVADGDLELVLHPVGTRPERWVLLLQDSERTTVHALGAADVPESLAAIATAVASRAGSARRLRVLAYGAWRRVDVHAIAPPGGPSLGERFVVDYPLGLPPARAETTAKNALVVGDPTGDLPRAREEAAVTKQALGARGLTVRMLVGEAASASAVGTGLVTPLALFHYAGHARYGGEDGLESALPLAEGGRLVVTDLLARPSAPRAVVLSACDAARSGEVEGLGLAQAFVVAGSEEVLAPVRPVADDLALALARELHAGAEGDLASRLRGAARSVRTRTPGADVTAYRVVTR